MMKRIMAVILTVVMVASLGTVAFAADPATVKDAIFAYGENMGLSGSALTNWLSPSLSVPTNVQVREDGKAWSNGPVEIEEKKVGSIPTFDFMATVDMEVVKTAFNDYVAAATTVINANGGANKAALLNELEDMPVTGTFTISVTIPNKLELSSAFKRGTDMLGFDADAKKIFHEVSREVSDGVATITIAVGGNATEAADKATKAELDTYLGDTLTLTCTDVQPEAFDEFEVSGTFSGQTVIGDSIATISYASEEVASATIEITKKETTSSDNVIVSSNKVTATFIVDGKVLKEVTGNNSVTVDTAAVVPSAKEGFEFAGWYYDAAFTKKAEGKLNLTANTTFYAKWDEIGSTTPSGSYFKDVNKGDWFYDAIMATCEMGLMKGIADDEFDPYGDVTRGMIVTVLYRLEQEPAAPKLNFSDVASGMYYTEAIAWANNNGIVKGYDSGLYGPDDKITREQLATIIYRYAQFKGMDAVTLAENLGQFTDNTSISEYAVSALNWIVGQGLMQGRGNNVLDPLAGTTRAELAAVLVRMLNVIK